MTKPEFAAEWKALLAVPLTDRPRGDEENETFMAEYFGRLAGWPVETFRVAITEYLESPACEACHRGNRRFPLWGELLTIMRRIRRDAAKFQPWPTGVHPAVALIHAQDDGHQPDCSACDDTGWRLVERGGIEAVELCGCRKPRLPDPPPERGRCV